MNCSIKEYIDSFIQIDFSFSLLIDFGNYVIEVESNEKALHESLTNYFREFIAKQKEPNCVIHAIEGPVPVIDREFTVEQPHPGKSKIKEEFIDCSDGRIVKKRLTGMHFFFGNDLHYAVGPCTENHNQVVNFINNRYIEFMLNSNSLLFHSSAVAFQDRGLSMSGFSGAGKSTLALHIMSKGVDFISNDRLMVKRESGHVRMYGVAKYPRINPGTILNNADLNTLLSGEERAELEDMPPDELWELERKYDLFIDEVYGSNRFYLQSPMNALVILNWKRDSNDDTVITQVNLSQREELYPAFMKSPGLFYSSQGEQDFSDAQYIKVLEQCDVFEVSGKIDFDMAADYFYTYLKEAR
jgi:HprK-related kinase B